MEKNRILNQSINQSPSLFDAPGTEAVALELQKTQWGAVNEYASTFLTISGQVMDVTFDLVFLKNADPLPSHPHQFKL